MSTNNNKNNNNNNNHNNHNNDRWRHDDDRGGGRNGFAENIQSYYASGGHGRGGGRGDGRGRYNNDNNRNHCESRQGKPYDRWQPYDSRGGRGSSGNQRFGQQQQQQQQRQRGHGSPNHNVKNDQDTKGFVAHSSSTPDTATAIADSPGRREDDTHMDDASFLKPDFPMENRVKGGDNASSGQRTSKDKLDALLKEWIQTQPRVEERLEAFKNLEWPDQVTMLLPDTISFDNLPAMERTVNWDSEMLRARNEVQDNIRDMEAKRQRLECRDAECYDRSSDDSDDDVHDVYGGTTAAQTSSSSSTDEYCRYIDMLRYCHPLTLGFHAVFLVSLNDNHWCYCPCGTHMRKWRELFRLDYLCTTSKCQTKTKYSPSSLLDHINSVEDPLHRYTGDYLKALYRNYHGDCHRHIAFEKLNDPAYQVTHKFLMKRVLEVLKILHKKAEEKDQLEKKYLEIKKKNMELEKTNRDFFKELQTKDELKKKLNIKFEDEEALSKDKLDEYYQTSKGHLDLQRSLHREVLKGREGKRRQKLMLKIHVPNAFRFQETFEKWYEEGEKDTTFLMRSLNNEKECRNRYHASKFFQHWEVQYEADKVDGKKIRLKKEEASETLAQDEGGPKRQFINEVTRQMGSLDVGFNIVTIDGKKEKNPFNLFELCDAGCKPVTDEKLETYGQLDKARAYYRAIGRIFALCFLYEDEDGTPITIPYNALPRLFRSYLFRGVDPVNRDYSIGDLLDDAYALLDKKHQLKDKTMEQAFQDICKYFGIVDLEGEEADVALRKKVKELFIDTRSIALAALKEGMTLDGCLFLEGFKMIPFKALSKIYFANPDLEAHDFLDENNEWQPFIHAAQEDYGGDEGLLAKCVGNQYRILNALKDVVRSSDSEWLGNFLCFCTGCSFLPDVSVYTKYKLTFEFNLSDNTHEEMLPFAHTCVKTLKLPFHAYSGDEEKFKHKLRQSVEYSKGSFNAR